MSNIKKVQKAFQKEDPAGLDSDEMELYSQMKEAAEENPEAVEAARKKKEKKRAPEKKRKEIEEMKKQVGTSKGREARTARERQQGRAPGPRTRAIAGGSNTTTTPPTSTTPLSSPLTSSFFRSFSSPISSSISSQPESASRLLASTFLNSPDENWKYLAWTLPWTLKQRGQGYRGMN
jgi:hypothetical protein